MRISVDRKRERRVDFTAPEADFLTSVMVEHRRSETVFAAAWRGKDREDTGGHLVARGRDARCRGELAMRIPMRLRRIRAYPVDTGCPMKQIGAGRLSCLGEDGKQAALPIRDNLS